MNKVNSIDPSTVDMFEEMGKRYSISFPLIALAIGVLLEKVIPSTLPVAVNFAFKPVPSPIPVLLNINLSSHDSLALMMLLRIKNSL